MPPRPYAGPSELSNGIHNHPSESGDAIAGPSKPFDGILRHPSESADAVPDEGFNPFNGIHNESGCGDVAEPVAGLSKGPHRLDTIQDFLGNLGMKRHMHLIFHYIMSNLVKVLYTVGN